jgi:uncharacterized protein
MDEAAYARHVTIPIVGASAAGRPASKSSGGKRVRRQILAATVAVLVCCLGLSSRADENTPGVDSARIAMAKQLLMRMGSEATFEASLKTMISESANTYKARRPGKAADIDKYFKVATARFLARYGEMNELLAAVYAENFTLDELSQIDSFYQSPAGKKFAAAQPAIAEQSLAIMKNWLARVGKEIESEVRAELRKAGAAR